MFEAVVMAGGGKVEPLTELEGVSNKAFISLNGKPLLGYVLDALTRAQPVSRIVVVGPEKELTDMQKQGYDFTLVKEEGSLLDNLAAALKLVDQTRLCLVVSGDIPLLNQNVVEQFIKLCEPFEDDFYYPILTRESCESCFPESRRTYVRLKEGTFTGGNLALLLPSWFSAQRDRLEMFIAYRKKPAKMLRILPLSFLFKYFLRQLSVAELESKLSKLLHLRARAVLCSYAEIGTDVDKISDLQIVRKALSR